MNLCVIKLNTCSFCAENSKFAGTIAYYSFFNGALKTKRTEDGQKKNIAHISDISNFPFIIQ